MDGLCGVPSNNATSTDPEGLQRIRQIVKDDQRIVSDPAAVFQLSEVFWDHLTRDSAGVANPSTALDPSASTSTLDYTSFIDEDYSWGSMVAPSDSDHLLGLPVVDVSNVGPGVGQSDPFDISAALIRFIAESAGNA